MGTLIQFHARASAGFAAARASKVICEQSLPEASRRMSIQRRGGMPRSRQELTVEAGKPSAAHTAPVPPKSSITVSAVSIATNIVRNPRTCQVFANCEPTKAPGHGGILAMYEAFPGMAKRLKDTREALGFSSQADYCKEIKIRKNVYNPFEKGRRPISLDVALKIRKRFEIPLDWIFCGDSRLLPTEVARALVRQAA